VKLSKSEARAIDKSWPTYDKDNPDVREVPTNLYQLFRSRGCSPEYIISRYRVGWDGRRLCFPIGKDRYNRRAVYTWDQPKVLFDNNKHDFVGGEHLMGRGEHIVITEGEWKACSIPLPFIGVWIGGNVMSKEQLDIICWHRPAIVVVALDGGEDNNRIVSMLSKKLVPATAWELPEELGPDDISMCDRVAGLLRVTVEDVLK
jgi:hypothetical protein